MPWHIEDEHPGCDGYAVVKDEDGELEGCHRTRTQAEAQLAALNIAEAEDDDMEDDDPDDLSRAESYTPTDGMVEEAQRGLDWRNEYGRGGTDIGVARARDIINRRDLSLDTVNRMKSYFARHEVDKEGQGWSPGEDGFPSAGRIAWALWGGDAGRTWAEAITRQTRAGTGPDAIITDIDETLIGRTGTNGQLIATLNEAEARIIVITGRLSSRRPETEDLLDRIGLEYDELIMSQGGDPNTHKRNAAESLLSRVTIVAAYDDNPDARAEYQSLGIDARTPRSNREIAESMLALIRRER